MEVVNGGEHAGFSSLRAKDAQSAILNLAEGDPVAEWGRLIFYATDVDGFWAHLCDKGFRPGLMGRALFSHARSGWARIIVCATDLVPLRTRLQDP
jgi:hypothetical protein